MGSVARFLVAEVSASRLGTTFPYGTLIVNVIGSFVLGLITGLVVSRAGLPMTVSTLVGVGFCGAFTTFTTFAVDTLTQRSVGMALLNLMLNNAVAIGAAAAGLYLILRH